MSAASKSKADVLNKMSTIRDPNAEMSAKECSLHKVTKTIVTSPAIYKPVGPYSQAILADKTLYVSGVLGMNPDGQIMCGGPEAQARQVLDNLKQVLEAGGASLESVVKTTILLSDMRDFKTVNKVYSEYFPKDYPARATFQVGKLHLDAAVEIEAIALSGDLVVSEAGPCPLLQDKYNRFIHYALKEIDGQAILADKTLYVSGVLGMDPKGQMVPGGVEAETRQVLDNLKHVLEAGGATLASVIKTTILLGDIQNFKVVNQVYSEYFPRDHPARATFQVGKLPQDAAVEIEAIALSGDLVVLEAGPCPCHKTP